MMKMYYKYNAKDAFRCSKRNISICLFVVVIAVTEVIFGKKYGFDRLVFVTLFLFLVLIYRRLKFIKYIVNNCSRHNSEEFDAVFLGLVERNKISVKIFNGRRPFLLDLDAPEIRKEAVDEILAKGGFCHVILNIYTKTVLEINESKTVEIPKMSEYEIGARKYCLADKGYIRKEIVTAYIGIGLGVGLLMLLIASIVFSIQWHYFSIIYCVLAFLLFYLSSIEEELSNLGIILQLRKIKGKGVKRKNGVYIGSRYIKSFCKTITGQESQCILKLYIVDKLGDIEEYYYVIDDDTLWDFDMRMGKESNVSIEFYENTKIVNKIEGRMKKRF